ncbi:MAG: flippase-like domain-containing protein [Planctomycetota bacterium]|nr:flippase-like domain-containing protein [Planctomycetota bacterium]
MEESRKREKRKKRILSWLFRVAVAAGFLFYLIFSGRLDLRIFFEREIRLEFVAFALLLYTLTNIKGIIRWQILLKAVNVKLSFFSALRLTYVGNIFSIMLPGVVGGDAVKALILHREKGERFSVALTSALGDRVLGTLAMLAVILFVAPFLHISSVKSQTLTLITIFFTIFTASFLLFLFAPWIEEPLKRLFVRLPWRRFSLRVLFASFKLRRRFLHSLFAFLLSIPAHLLSVIAVFFLLKAISLDAPFLPLTYAVLVALLLEAIPISIAGLGVGEQAFDWLFSLLFVGEVSVIGAEVALLMHITRIASSVPGLFFLFWKEKKEPQEL